MTTDDKKICLNK